MTSTIEVTMWAKKSRWGELAEEVLKSYFPSARVVLGWRGDAYPGPLCNQVDILISFSSPWVVNESDLARVRRAALNFHPGSPRYPGIGCTNFAIYEEAQTYGPTCHYMEASVDSGPIISYTEFQVSHDETVWSLTNRTYAHMLAQFSDVLSLLVVSEMPDKSDISWERRPYTRRELESLAVFYDSDDLAEVQRRKKAMDFPKMPGARHVTGTRPVV
jgi:methionyl-tRNA formyltransferase